MMVIHNLQEQSNQIQMKQQRQVNQRIMVWTAHLHSSYLEVKHVYHRPPEDVYHLSKSNSEHILPVWIAMSKDPSIEQIDCEMNAGV